MVLKLILIFGFNSDGSCWHVLSRNLPLIVALAVSRLCLVNFGVTILFWFAVVNILVAVCMADLTFMVGVIQP